MLKKLSIILISLLAIGNVNASPSSKPKVLHKCTSRDSPTLVLACSMYAEARGQDQRGMLMVGNVVLNRKNHEDYPSKIKKVVYQKHQFSYVSTSPMRVYENDSWQTAKDLAKFLILLENKNPSLRVTLDPTKGALFYIKRGTKVKWLKSMKRVARYKDHDFYVERENS